MKRTRSDFENENRLRRCADQGDLAGLRALLASGVNVNSADVKGFTALEYALNAYPHLPEKDHLAIVKVLVDAGADVNAQAQNGQIPLFNAAANGLVDVVVCLLENGADAGARMDTGATALYDLPELIVQHPKNFKLIVEEDGRKVTISDPDEIRRRTGSHPDDEYNARLEAARLLIVHGVDLNAVLYETGQPVLFVSAAHGADEIVDLVLEAGGVDVNQRDKWGLTALHYACRNGRYGAARRLVKARADVNAQESYGFTPLHEAAENGHLRIVKLLVQNQADPGLGLTRRYRAYPVGATAKDLARKTSVRQYLETC